MNHKPRIVIIGAGISGMSAACHLSRMGFEVTVFEKNEQPGGRIDFFESSGFAFDMGPSWYWMPNVFERFYETFGYKTSDFYQLIPLDPGFEIVFEENKSFPVWKNLEQLYEEFEKTEPGSAEKFEQYLKKSKKIYEVAMGDMVYKPYLSLLDFIDPQAFNPVLIKSVFTTVSKEVRKLFKHPHLRQLLEFPVIFLGSTADKIPALYHLMNYAAFVEGTWYPEGGMYQIAKAFETIAKDLGVQFFYNTPVKKLVLEGNLVKGVHIDNDYIQADAVLSSADYVFTEKLLPKSYRNYDESYWEKRTFAPSALLFYLGIDKPLPKLRHHTLFFDADFESHIAKVYNTHQWPENPLFYVSATSKTDKSVAPPDKENLVILVPISVEIEENEENIDAIYHNIISRLEKFSGESIAPHVVFKKHVAKKHFINRYNSFKGNAYGLANTLMQTAIFKPKMKNHKIKNLFYTGQLTVPGPGVPPCIISGEIAAGLIQNFLNLHYE